MTAPIRHIVFDIGRVLIHYDPDIPFSRIIPDARERQWFFENVCTHDWNLEQDRGREWAEAEAELIGQHPDYADQIRAFRTHWHDMVSHELEDSVSIMLALIEQGHDVTMLTNFAPDTFREACERFPFLKAPRGVTVSGEIGLIKPDRAIFDHHTEAFDLNPENTLFIDDVPVNVAGAHSAGWQAVQFTGADTLKADLERHGLRL